jgi:predicted RecB family nuclease
VQVLNGATLFSASDLVNFLECEHTTTLGLVDLITPLQRAESDESNKLIQDKGYAHEELFLESLRAKGLRITEIPQHLPAEAAARATLEALAADPDIIFQAAFLSPPFYGRADFLRRIEGRSRFGDWQYEVMDTKLARSVKAKFVIQLCFYSDLLAEAQAAEPRSMHLVLGDGTEKNFRFANYSRYFRQLRARFAEFKGAAERATYPERCDHCQFCDWRVLCQQKWIDDDYLNQVAGIRRDQIPKLKAQGIPTVEALASVGENVVVPKMQPETVNRLRAQAALQVHRRRTGEPKVEVLPLDPDERRGFYRLPAPSAGDIFFDMEGDPFEEGGLEYLFGIWYRDGNDSSSQARQSPSVAPAAATQQSAGVQFTFKAFWAHTRAEEKLAFESLIDFITDRRKSFPELHVYHYAPYEPTALKRLMSFHGSREAQVNDLLRGRVLVDLYAVVRESIRTSEPGLSIKDIECFYMEKRAGEVQDAGTSIVQYERWRATGDKAALEAIERYNEDDCRSTQLLRDWLVGLRPAGIPWRSLGEGRGESESTDRQPSERTLEIEAGLARLKPSLLAGMSEDAAPRTSDEQLRQLTFHLLDFHRRCANPEWWAVFARQEMTEEELIANFECLGGLRSDGRPPRPEKRSFLYGYSYPEQDTKLREGDAVRRADTTESLGTISVLAENERKVELKVSAKRETPPAVLSIGPEGPIDTDALRKAVWRFAESVIADDGRFAAVRGFLRKDPPRPPITGGSSSFPRRRESNFHDHIYTAVSSLDESYLFIQGPPGAGKTTTGSQLIVRLLAAGKRVGVTSNSHKAVNNLLDAVLKVAKETSVRFRGAKKSTASDPETEVAGGTVIQNVYSNADIVKGNDQLIAGTAWLFADLGLEAKLDYLFVDEAGQVSLPNLVAAGTSARNIVLLGDQMQLGQPIQGDHPGRSGESTLDYLLDGEATVPEDRGIFVATSWRMHPDVCRFISDAVYDGRLEPEPGNERQHLILNEQAHAALAPAGIRFVPAVHEGCSQKCEPEAVLVAEILASLLEQSYEDKGARRHRMTLEDVLVVAPYNAQVNFLRSRLPTGARVGTIDKFQGQEAQAVIVSMTTSSGEYLPRNIEFLYNKNRLNVAASRAKCLAVVVGSPQLLRIRCSSAEQMELVNTLCWLSEYSARFAHVAPPNRIPSLAAIFKEGARE